LILKAAPMPSPENTITTTTVDGRGAAVELAAPAAEERVGRLYRLLARLSPAFPIGAFSYSHGLAAEVESGAVRDRDSLQAWAAAVLMHGSGRIDADILREAYDAAAAGDLAGLSTVNQRGLAYRATAELTRESSAQGAAFLATCRAAWPNQFLDEWAVARAARSHPDPFPVAGQRRKGVPPPLPFEGERVCYAAVVGAATARAQIPLEDALAAYLQAMMANLVCAGLRLGVVGQTDGQRILAALEPAVIRAALDAIVRDPADFGAATFAADLASMAHETQYTRLFRS
jgi:urease accessory protein